MGLTFHGLAIVRSGNAAVAGVLEVATQRDEPRWAAVLAGTRMQPTLRVQYRRRLP